MFFSFLKEIFLFSVVYFFLFFTSGTKILFFSSNSSNLLLLYLSLFCIFCIWPFCSSKIQFFLLFFSSWFSVLFFLTESSFLFLLFFELSSFPMVFLILVYGLQTEALMSAYFLGLYSLIGGLFFFIWLGSGLLENSFLWEKVSSFLGFCFVFSFCVKLPSYFVHLWLPLAHVEAPTVGSMILAAILLKLGSFGLFKLGSSYPLILVFISVVGVSVIPFVTFLQSDVKCLVAYSSIAHMGVLTISLWLNSNFSEYAGWLMQMSHGFCSCLLFLMVGTFSHSCHTRALYLVEGSDKNIFYVNIFFNMGAPISIAFVSELFFFFSLSLFSFWSFFFVFWMILTISYYNLFLALAFKKKESNSILSLPSIFMLLTSMNLMFVFF